MQNGKFLEQAAVQLAQAGIGTGRLDALVLLEDVTGRDRAWLLAHPEFELTAVQAQKLKNLFKRRVKHEPLAHIRGKTEFYGREFLLTPAVLEPRPESETMIDLLKAIPVFKSPEQSEHIGEPSANFAFPKIASTSPRKHDNGQKQQLPIRVADVGAGSGALGITAQLELPNTQVELLEIDSKALKVAKTNVDLFTLRVPAVRSDLLSGSSQNYDILLCNLPYVPDDFQVNPAALREPRIAIFGGPDGLDIYRKLFRQVQKLTYKPLYILTEALPPQHGSLTEIAANANYQLNQTDDFIQVFQRNAATPL